MQPIVVIICRISVSSLIHRSTGSTVWPSVCTVCTLQNVLPHHFLGQWIGFPGKIPYFNWEKSMVSGEDFPLNQSTFWGGTWRVLSTRNPVPTVSWCQLPVTQVLGPSHSAATATSVKRPRPVKIAVDLTWLPGIQWDSPVKITMFPWDLFNEHPKRSPSGLENSPLLVGISKIIKHQKDWEWCVHTTYQKWWFFRGMALI